MNQQIKVIAALVHRPHFGFLQIKRSVAKGGFWTFPSGVIHIGETEQDAAIRETLEETSIFCKPTVRLGQRIHPNTQAAMIYWLCEYIKGEPQNLEPEKADEVGFYSGASVIERAGPSLFIPALNALKSLRY